MRSLPTFSDARFSFSFFLTTPAKNPRTECCCQSVAFMMASIVAPLGWRSRFSTVDCLEAAPETAGAIVVGEAASTQALAGLRGLVVDFATLALEGLDFGFTF